MDRTQVFPSASPLRSHHRAPHRDIFSTSRPLQSRPAPSLRDATRAEVRAYFENGWEITEALFSSLRTEAAFLRSPVHGLRHPMIFYYGHTAVFYINKLLRAGMIDQPIDPFFESHFAVGVDENSWDDMSKNEQPWPPLEMLKSYREQVHARVARFIETTEALSPGHPPLSDQDPIWALFMAMEHERIHVETSAALIRELPQEFVEPPERFPPLHSSFERPSSYPPVPDNDYPLNPWVKFSPGSVHIGKPRDWPVFSWDNETGDREAEVPSFFTTRFVISNGEFLDFVLSGGYANSKYWSEEGWSWRTFRQASLPPFWHKAKDDVYRLRTTFETIDMPWSWPAIVNFHEAKAFASWRSEQEGAPCRLLTEAEHLRLRQTVDPSYPPDQFEDWYGSEGFGGSPLYRGANFELRCGSEGPVDMDLGNAASLTPPPALPGVFGNVWQWCEDTFYPLSGFTAHPLYSDYSAPSFDGKHQMILGGSFISTGTQATPWVRSHFRPHFFQNAGFRLVRENFS